jgi:hypothetical protein
MVVELARCCIPTIVTDQINPIESFYALPEAALALLMQQQLFDGVPDES